MGFLVAIGTIITGIVLLFILLKSIFPWLKDDLVLLRRLGKFILLSNFYSKKGVFLIDRFERHASQQPGKTFLRFEDEVYSYEESDRLMNRVAHAGLDMGIRQGQVVAMFMLNEPEFIWA